MPDVHTPRVGKHLIDLDESALTEARAELGTDTVKATVNEALRRAGGSRQARVERALAALSAVEFEDRRSAWRWSGSSRPAR